MITEQEWMQADSAIRKSMLWPKDGARFLIQLLHDLQDANTSLEKRVDDLEKAPPAARPAPPRRTSSSGESVTRPRKSANPVTKEAAEE
jgi:hypothetical protein